MKRLLIVLGLLSSVILHAQKGYTINLSIDKIYCNGDSIKFPKGKKFNVTTTDKTDTLEIGKCGMETIGIQVQVRKVKAGDQVRTEIGYAFYKRNGNKWELIYNFGFTDRYALLKYPANGKLPPPKEEYHCEYGVPIQFSASFRMDVYSN
ncbi:MAG TPA: hypothetical protein VL651_12780 [Bacteroidia bacterium]|jgi:hypothetical protein|nr:hypothetical protein [Bacteroidia bacterium]